MNVEEAERELSDFELVACLQGALGDIKELRDLCLEADIPVLLGREDACCGKGGCGCAPKLQLLARPEDASRISDLVQQRWREMAMREGTVTADHAALAVSAAGDPPCPACGTAAPLESGACIDCGLQLE